LPDHPRRADNYNVHALFISVISTHNPELGFVAAGFSPPSLVAAPPIAAASSVIDAASIVAAPSLIASPPMAH